MRYLRTFLAVLLGLCLVPKAQAQSPIGARVVQSCSNSNMYASSLGGFQPPTIDVNGVWCSTAGSGGGGGSGTSGPVYGQDATGSAPSKPPVFVGGVDPSGFVRPLKVDGAGQPFVTVAAPPADLRQQNQTLAAGTVGNNLVIPLGTGGYATLGLVMPGLAASGATVSFSVSKDNGATYDAIGAFNAAAGSASSTRTGTDAGTSFGIATETLFKITVTTAGTGNITVSYSASVAATRIANISPLVAQTATGKDIGGVEQFGAWSVGLTGTLPAFAATPTFNLGTLNGAALDTSVQQVKTTLGTPFQAGGSIGNTAFGISGSLPAFAAVPAFKIDQTTPGTTNKVSIGTDGSVAVSNFPASQTVSGTVTANQGAAGAAAWKVDGSAVTQPISAASLPLPAGAATAANQTATTGPAAPGTSATSSALAGLQYNSTPPTVANGQQVAQQADVNGNTKVNVTTALPTGANTIGGVTEADGANAALGSTNSAAYTGTGNANAIAALKGLYAATAAPTALTPVVVGPGASTAIVKASPGSLVSVSANCTAACWLMVFNAVTAPADGATTGGTASGNLQECVPIPANGTGGVTYANGPPEAFTVGITAVVSSTSCATKTASAVGFINGRAR